MDARILSRGQPLHEKRNQPKLQPRRIRRIGRKTISRHRIYGWGPSQSRQCIHSCTYWNCDNVESYPYQYWKCPLCLTTYCSSSCEKKDAYQHIQFCTSECAYTSHLNAWKSTLPQSLLCNAYMDTDDGELSCLWHQWLNTDIIKWLLIRLNIDPYAYPIINASDSIIY